MDEIRKLVSANMKAARERLGYSQARLAELSGVSTTHITEIETGRKYPSSKTLIKISDALKMKPYQLYLDDDATEQDRLMSVTEQIRQYLNTSLDQLEGKDSGS